MPDTPLPVQDLREIFGIYADTFLIAADLAARLGALGLEQPAKNAHALSTRCYVQASNIRGLLQYTEGEAGTPHERSRADAIMDGAESIVMADVKAMVARINETITGRHAHLGELAPFVGGSQTLHTEADVPFPRPVDLYQIPAARPPLQAHPQPAVCILGHSMAHDRASCFKCGARRDDGA